MFSKFIAMSFFISLSALAEFSTNAARFVNPPKWLTAYKANAVVAKIEKRLEWSTRRVDVTYYSSEDAFEKALGISKSAVVAFARRSDQSIHLGPKVKEDNFTSVFGHELAHVIVFQKFKMAIPKWLEEGLANRVAENIIIDYNWLAKQSRLNVSKLGHPLDAKSEVTLNFHYMAALGVVHMLESKCTSLRELLNLSLRSTLEDAVPTFCKIPDINSAFWKWVDSKKN